GAKSCLPSLSLPQRHVPNAPGRIVSESSLLLQATPLHDGSPRPGYDASPGDVAEWLGRALQTLVQRFESPRRLRRFRAGSRFKGSARKQPGEALVASDDFMTVPR